jgi:hypothetical protein
VFAQRAGEWPIHDRRSERLIGQQAVEIGPQKSIEVAQPDVEVKAKS